MVLLIVSREKEMNRHLFRLTWAMLLCIRMYRNFVPASCQPGQPQSIVLQASIFIILPCIEHTLQLLWYAFTLPCGYDDGRQMCIACVMSTSVHLLAVCWLGVKKISPKRILYAWRTKWSLFTELFHRWVQFDATNLMSLINP